ncbi:hypothetical protein ADICEAN_02790 [Cesiribacter andamanensis AMV16]|uniref:Putative auto-transporter adhesin head GIN domain-containing protein n=2 Tax=Cesiribacter TaxID=1133570 RepID=M7N065_9BACT|nr:hypothetical protein ADICEAN_02790 [Cesiribacter andamanensis AMV16]
MLGLIGSLPTTAQERVTRSVANFTALKVMSGIDVYLSQSDSPSVKIAVDSEETLQDLVVEVDASNTLVLRLPANKQMRRWWGSQTNTRRVKAYVSFRQLTDIQVSGGSDLFGEGPLRFQRLRMAASGGSDIRMNLTADELEVTCSGGADAELQGRAGTFTARASGGSDLKAQELEAQVATVNVSGGSDGYIKVVRELTATASGGSDIVYWGSPAKVSSNASGGSEIKKGG